MAENDWKDGWLGDIYVLPKGTLVIPSGTKKLVGQEREYANAEGEYMTRDKYKQWSKDLIGKEVDPACALFKEMGRKPIPPDVDISSCP